MFQIFKTILILVSIFAFSCKSNTLNGVYVCDNTNKKPQTTIQKDGYNEITMDFTCAITHFKFTGNSTVQIGTNGGEVVSSYVMDKKNIVIKGTGSDILLKVEDERTLSGEGIAIGKYHKN